MKDLKEMLTTEPTVSEWSSPLVVVPKKHGGVRLCVAYCQLRLRDTTPTHEKAEMVA